MTGCGCHDPAVFGHQWRCEDDLGPPAPDRPGPREDAYRAMYGSHIQTPAAAPVPKNAPDKRRAWWRNWLENYSRLKAAEQGVIIQD